MNNKKPKVRSSGLTLVEIIISMVILALIMGGLANLFLAAKQYTLHSSFRMTAAELGRYYLERLHLHLSAETWDQSPVNPIPNNLLTVGQYKSTNNPYTAKYPDASYTTVDVAEEAGFEERFLAESNLTYYPVYVVESRDGVRKVKLIINWTEPSL